MMTLLQVGDYLGTFVFAVTGALAAAEKRLDIGGFVLLGFVTGVGGGTMRDLLLVRGEVFWASQPVYIVICILAAAATYLAADHIAGYRRLLVWCDAAGLAIFAVIGAGIAHLQSAPPLVAILMGALTASGGGIIRDIIRNELPIILHREIYVTAALAGAAAAIGLESLGAAASVSIAGGILIAFALRAAGIVFDLHLPAYKRETPDETS